MKCDSCGKERSISWFKGNPCLLCMQRMANLQKMEILDKADPSFNFVIDENGVQKRIKKSDRPIRLIEAKSESDKFGCAPRKESYFSLKKQHDN